MKTFQTLYSKCQMVMSLILILVIILPTRGWIAETRTHLSSPRHLSLSAAASSSNDNESDRLRRQAQELLEQARSLREDLPSSTVVAPLTSPWSLDNNSTGVEYRLYVDIGREDGTWMDPRWGASGQRIDFTVDVRFLSEVSPSADGMVPDNQGGSSTAVYQVEAARQARLRGGFGKMACRNGSYRIDLPAAAFQRSSTLRFFLQVDGTPRGEFGDIDIPEGNLYFSLPAFGTDVSQLSVKEGIVSVRQIGWNTGWRREESRIVGVFRAKPLADAKRRDGF